TDEGRSFHARTRVFLHDLAALRGHAAQLAMGEETALTIVIGDLCPLPATLALLRRFFERCPGTRLHLHFEALSGPWERLLGGEAARRPARSDRRAPVAVYRQPGAHSGDHPQGAAQVAAARAAQVANTELTRCVTR